METYRDNTVECPRCGAIIEVPPSGEWHCECGEFGEEIIDCHTTN